jgi:alkanesulfonate monooxygenase SsuD/methylene tetrahydromethanopterin reductase-like flavin-dependent oxidoreductase (luciferase family)
MITTILRDSWSAGTVVKGASTDPVSVTPKPLRSTGVPVWLAARSRVGIKRAARVADGFLAARVNPAEFADQVQTLRSALDEVGRSADEVAISVHCPVFAWPDDSAWEHVRDSYHYIEWKYRDMVVEPHAGRTESGAPPPLSTSDESALRAGAIVGTPAEVASQIRAYQAAADGDLHFIARLYWPGMETGVQREALAVFAEHVAPLFERKADLLGNLV